MGDQAASGEPAPIEVELVEEDTDTLPEATPNTAASGLETIRGGPARLSHLVGLPRALRALGALAVVAALIVAWWPAPGRHQAGPRPGPSPTAPSPPAVNVDLYKVRVSGTSLSQDYRDHAVMGLALTNESPSQLTVVNAELWDALGTRLGYSATWPAGYVQARASETLAMYLPYSCTVLITTPVLPVTIRYSVSSPEDLSISHNYDYPLDPTILDEFMHARAGLCTGPAGGVFASAVGTLRPEGDHHDRHSFDIDLTVDATGQTGWTLHAIS
ncbi:MAG: hypothetical protein HOV83_00775, partial [Catenulispora sp.]|nr:hypothetical protein [Catenulispora sp.]